MNGHSYKPQGTVDLETLNGVSFLVIYLFLVHICTIWAWKWLYFPIFVMLHHCWYLLWHHHDLETISNAPQHNRHPQKVLWKFQLNQTDGFQDIAIFVHPLSFWSDSPLSSELCQYWLHPHLCLPHLSSVKPLSMFHSPHMTGKWLTGCESFACSSASLRLGSGFTKSRLRNTLTICSASSWVRKVTWLWTTGSHQMKATNEIQRNSLITLKPP